MSLPNEDSNALLTYFIENTGPAIDKWLHYFNIYNKNFFQYRGKSIKVLEIGVQNGGSTKMWQNYFGKEALITCVDIDPGCKRLEKDGFKVFIGDQESLDFWDSFKEQNETFDIIIEDGGHGMRQQINTFEALFPILNDGGTYLCEDTHTSYFSILENAGLNNPNSFIEYSKRLIDRMHGWYFKPMNEINNDDEILNSLDSIFFYDSIVIFNKKKKNHPSSLIRGIDSNKQTVGYRAGSYLDLRKMAGIKD